jgi:hypothetical protein
VGGDINKLCNVVSCWIYIGILLAHPFVHISRIRVNTEYKLHQYCNMLIVNIVRMVYVKMDEKDKM